MISSTTPIIAGLCYIRAGRRCPFPLASVEVVAKQFDLNAEVKLTQTYSPSLDDCCIDPWLNHWRNQSTSEPIECVYVFPLDEFSAVSQFACNIDGVTVQGIVKAKAEAKAEYTKAVRQGHQAALLEQQQENIFECRVGNLKPNSVAKVHLTYITSSNSEGRKQQFLLPMIVAPKYSPVTDFNDNTNEVFTAPQNSVHHGITCDYCHTSPIIGVRWKCSICPDYDLCDSCESRSPPVHDTNHPRLKIKQFGENPVPKNGAPSSSTPVPATPIGFTSTLPREFRFSLEAVMASPIIDVSCASHPNISIERPDSNSLSAHKSATPISHMATVRLNLLDSFSLSKDLVIAIEQEKCFDPRCIMEIDPVNGTTACSLSLPCPSLSLTEASQLSSEFVFLLDRSGSMQGSSIEALKQSMLLILKSLPIHATFQIIGFGSTYSSLFPSGSVSYNDSSLNQAISYINNCQADLGGTEIFAPLRFALDSADKDNEKPRSIFLMTDGQVSNIGELVSLVSKYCRNTRVFSIGIGSAVDRALCKKLSRAGNGFTEFVSIDNDSGDMRSKVLRQLGRSMQPMLTNISVDWENLSKNEKFQPCPRQIPAIFPGTRFSLYGLDCKLPSNIVDKVKTGQSIKDEDFTSTVTITARSNRLSNSNNTITMKMKISPENFCIGNIIHRLAARSRIQELEQNHAEDFNNYRSNDSANIKIVEEEIKQLALRFGLASRATSFIVNFSGRERSGESVSEEEDSAVAASAFVPQHSLSFGGAARFGSGAQQVPMMSKSRAMPMMAMSILPGGSRVASNQIIQSATSSFGAPSSTSLFGSIRSSAPPPAPMASNSVDRLQCGTVAPQKDSSLRDSDLRLNPDDEGMDEECSDGSEDDEYSESMLSAECESAKKKSSGPLGGLFSTIKSAIGGNNNNNNAEKMEVHSYHNEKSSSISSLSPFDAIIELQSASGTWNLSPELISIVHRLFPTLSSSVTIASLRSLSQSLNVTEVVIATELALRILTVKYSDREVDWNFLSAKSQAFVDKQIQPLQKQEIQRKLQEFGVC